MKNISALLLMPFFVLFMFALILLCLPLSAWQILVKDGRQEVDFATNEPEHFRDTLP